MSLRLYLHSISRQWMMSTATLCKIMVNRSARVYWILDRIIAGFRHTVVEVINARLSLKIIDVAIRTQVQAMAQRGHDVVNLPKVPLNRT